jgi:hypothetical protein
LTINRKSIVKLWMKEGDNWLTDDEKYTTQFDLGGDLAIVIRPDLYVGYVGIDPNNYFSAFLS